MAYHKADQFYFALDAFNLAGETALDGEAEQRRLDAERAAKQRAADRLRREQSDLFSHSDADPGL
jgi:hypothetical protein